MSESFSHEGHLSTSDLSLPNEGMYAKDIFEHQGKLSIAVTNLGIVQKPNNKVVLKIFFNNMLIIEYRFRRQLLKRPFQLSENHSMKVTDSSINSAYVFEGTLFISEIKSMQVPLGDLKQVLFFIKLYRL